MSTISSYLPAATTNTATTSSASGSSSANGSASIGGDFNTFLSLLTTQLQNQSPTSPVDSNQFTQQLVEFAGVQQQVQSNTYLQQLVSASQSSQISSAASYVGTTVQASGDQGYLTSGGSATFGYTLPSTASSVQVTIKDSAGNTVFTGSGTGNSGSNTVTWNGTNSLNGSTEPAGTYTISVAATGTGGTSLTATPYISGTVSSASISNGVVELNIGGLQVPATSVTNISNLQSAGSSLASELQSIL
jgi:flagellar basal-body rod modification protein FlgD